MPNPIPPSSPSGPEPDILEALQQASTKQDVRNVLQRYESEAVHAAWGSLSPAQRGALHLVRFTDGRIFHELDNTD